MYSSNYSPFLMMQQGGFKLLMVFVILDLVLKGVALWKAGRNNQIYWFIALFLINSLGILPAIYLIFFQPKKAVRKGK
jgi:hypothetical protein